MRYFTSEQRCREIKQCFLFFSILIEVNQSQIRILYDQSESAKYPPTANGSSWYGYKNGDFPRSNNTHQMIILGVGCWKMKYIVDIVSVCIDKRYRVTIYSHLAIDLSLLSSLAAQRRITVTYSMSKNLQLCCPAVTAMPHCLISYFYSLSCT